MNSEKVVTVMKEWMNKNGFEDYQTVRYGSLFWPVPVHKKLTNITELPLNMNERFYKLFETMLNKGIYLAPNAYEVGFVSLAHNDEILKEMKERLWT